MGPPKSVAMIALEKMKPKGDAEDAADGGADDGLEMACQDILNAIDSKDVGALADALKSAVSMCDGGSYK